MHEQMKQQLTAELAGQSNQSQGRLRSCSVDNLPPNSDNFRTGSVNRQFPLHFSRKLIITIYCSLAKEP